MIMPTAEEIAELEREITVKVMMNDALKAVDPNSHPSLPLSPRSCQILAAVLERDGEVELAREVRSRSR